MNEKKNYPYKSANNSRNHYNSNNTVINLVNIIYDDEFVSLINNLSSSLKDYFKLLNKLINNIREITSTLGNQTLYSKCLLNDCISLDKNNNTDKFIQLSDRIDIIDNNKKLLDNNISLIDTNMSSFLDKAKILFKKMKITRNSKLNNTIKKQKYIQNNNKNEKININYNNKDSNITRRNNYSCNNERFHHPNLNQYSYQNYYCTTLKKNKTSKSYSKNLLNNNNFNYEYNINKSDYNKYNKNNIDEINDENDRQKTINFNIRQFLFKTNQNKLDNALENSNESFKLTKSLSKMKNSNNSLFNYCSLINSSNIRYDRNMNIKENLNFKNINSFSNDISKKNKNNIKNMNIKNLKNSNIFDYKHCWNKNNLELKNYKNKNIEYIPNYFNSFNSMNKINNINKNNMCCSLANKIIEYFNIIKEIDNDSEEKKYKLKKMKKIILDLCLSILHKCSNHSRNENKLNLTNSVKFKENSHTNDLRNNIMNFSKIYNKNKRNQNENLFNKEKQNINFNYNRNNISKTYKDTKKDNIFRNSEEIKIYNSVGNLNNNIINSLSNNNNLMNNNQIGNNIQIEINYKNKMIDFLNSQLNKKNEYINKISNILIRKQNNFNNLRIIKPPKVEIIQKIKFNKKKKIFIIKKEIILFFRGIENRYKIKNNLEIREEKNNLKIEINNLKNNNEELNLKLKEKEEENLKINNLYNNSIKEFKNLKEENVKLIKEISDLKKSKNDLDKEIKNLNNKNKDLNEQNIENKDNSEIIELKKENYNLNIEIQELKSKLKNENNKTYKYKYELIIEEMNNKKNEINQLNEKIEELNNNNKILTNKLDEMDFNNKSLEEEKNNLKIKINKLEEEKKEMSKRYKNEEKFSEKKIVITNSDYQPEDDYSDLIYNLNDDQSREDKNLIETNKKLQEKINQLQMELNKQLLNEKPIQLNNKNKILNNNYIKENSLNKININKENEENIENLKNSFAKELKIKEDMIEDLQLKLKNMNNNGLNKIIKQNKFYNHKDYIILCDKNFNNLQWFLLAPKTKEKNKINKNEFVYNYDNVFWVDKEHIEKEIDKYNSFVKENDEENKIIINYIKKLEEKENIISKLSSKLYSIEKNINYKSSNDKNSSKNRSKSSNNKPFTEVKLFEKDEEKENEEYKESEKIEEYKKSTYGSMDIEKKYYNIEEELRADKNQIQIYKTFIKDLEAKLEKLKEMCKNFFSKIGLSKLEKEEAKQILKIFNFNDNEISFIINKKRNK